MAYNVHGISIISAEAYGNSLRQAAVCRGELEELGNYVPIKLQFNSRTYLGGFGTKLGAGNRHNQNGGEWKITVTSNSTSGITQHSHQADAHT